MRHSLAILGVDDTLDSLGPYRLMCWCGYESEELKTMADIEAAARSHKQEVLNAPLGSSRRQEPPSPR